MDQHPTFKPAYTTVPQTMSKIDSNSHQASPYYPSPSIMPGMPGNSVPQYFSYTEGQDSPPSPDASMSSLNLPPIRSVDGRPQQPQQPQHQQPPGQGPPPMSFYQPYPMPHPPQDPNAPIRYPLPPNPDGRIMSGGRHKKEIKRRTKTGCLTCRKRRIKVCRRPTRHSKVVRSDNEMRSILMYCV